MQIINTICWFNKFNIRVIQIISDKQLRIWILYYLCITIHIIWHFWQFIDFKKYTLCQFKFLGPYFDFWADLYHFVIGIYTGTTINISVQSLYDPIIFPLHSASYSLLRVPSSKSVCTSMDRSRVIPLSSHRQNCSHRQDS